MRSWNKRTYKWTHLLASCVATILVRSPWPNQLTTFDVPTDVDIEVPVASRVYQVAPCLFYKRAQVPLVALAVVHVTLHLLRTRGRLAQHARVPLKVGVACVRVQQPWRALYTERESRHYFCTMLARISYCSKNATAQWISFSLKQLSLV